MSQQMLKNWNMLKRMQSYRNIYMYFLKQKRDESRKKSKLFIPQMSLTTNEQIFSILYSCYWEILYSLKVFICIHRFLFLVYLMKK